MKLLLAALRESATTTLKKGRFLAPPRERRITTMMNSPKREKGVILRELGTDWQGNSGFARAMKKSKQKPREGHCPRGVGRKPSLRIRSDGRSSYCVKNTAIPPLGNPTPPAVAEGPLVNGEKTKPPPVNT